MRESDNKLSDNKFVEKTFDRPFMVLSFSSNIQKMAGGVWTNSIQPENYNIILKIPPRAAYFFVETDFYCALTIL